MLNKDPFSIDYDSNKLCHKSFRSSSFQYEVVLLGGGGVYSNVVLNFGLYHPRTYDCKIILNYKYCISD